MIRRLVATEPVIAKINVTPIIDVALVLVIILLITAPMMSLADLDLDLPRVRTHGFGDEVRVNVTLGTDGRLAIDDVIVAPGSFENALRDRLADEEDALVVVRADATTPHRIVSDVLRLARGAGAARLAIAARPEESGP